MINRIRRTNVEAGEEAGEEARGLTRGLTANGRANSFRGFSLIKKSETHNAVVAEFVPKDRSLGGSIWRSFGAASRVFVYYPKEPEHINAFAGTVRCLLPGGVAQILPGSVGSIHVRINQKKLFGIIPINGKQLAIYNLQGNFKQKSNGRIIMPFAISEQHAGWQEHLLREAFRSASTNAISEVVLKIKYERENGRMRVLGKKNAEMFRKVAGEFGFTVAPRVRKTGVSDFLFREFTLKATKR